MFIAWQHVNVRRQHVNFRTPLGVPCRYSTTEHGTPNGVREISCVRCLDTLHF